MDPNQYNFQQCMFHLMQNQQNFNPQNSQFPSPSTNSTVFFPPPNNPNIYFRPPINTHGMNFSHHEPETPNGFMSERQVPQFSTQVGIENITVEKEQRHPIVGVDQKVDSFWLRITDNYNQYRGQSREKLQGQLKSRWHRINGLVQKFVGCYKQAVREKKSGASEKDILVNAHAFFEQDEGAPFNLEYAWRLLKDEPKWMGASIENSSKRTKNFVSGAYTTSPNSETPSSYEFNSSSPMERPMGQKAAKRKGKAKKNANATEPPSSVISDTMNKRMEVMENLARLKEEENKLVKEKMEFEAMQFIMSDTSKMNDSQREFHEKRCNNLKEKYGW
ncbi:glutathione S-transferase T2-like [Vicia villosa]|uniref:glutathione S-transferase T2-like n=1 Tax=Vicia villosa TaxID=3911 RepID=UPI00273B6FB0|nr:glutathione S-transferase T2-like [Vicia villosa]